MEEAGSGTAWGSRIKCCFALESLGACMGVFLGRIPPRESFFAALMSTLIVIHTARVETAKVRVNTATVFFAADLPSFNTSFLEPYNIATWLAM